MRAAWEARVAEVIVVVQVAMQVARAARVVVRVALAQPVEHTEA